MGELIIAGLDLLTERERAALVDLWTGPDIPSNLRARVESWRSNPSLRCMEIACFTGAWLCEAGVQARQLRYVGRHLPTNYRGVHFCVVVRGMVIDVNGSEWSCVAPRAEHAATWEPVEEFGWFGPPILIEDFPRWFRSYFRRYVLDLNAEHVTWTGRESA